MLLFGTFVFLLTYIDHHNKK
nr:hypothetical protein [Lactobacillus johnsonii]